MIPDPLLWLLVLFVGAGFGIMIFFNTSELKSKIDALKAALSSAAGATTSALAHVYTGWGYLVNLALAGNTAAIIFFIGFIVCFVVLLANTLKYKVAIR